MDNTLELRLHGLLGLCARARQGSFGEDGCLKAIREGGCALLLLDEGASAATQKRYRDACGSHSVPIRLLPQGLLSGATGRTGVAMALRDGGLCQQLLSLLPDGGMHEEISGGVCAE